MKEENLGDTKPIKTLDSIETLETEPRTRAEMYEDLVTEKREDRYKESLEDKLNKDMQEEAEKALAIKNIQEAETLLEEEKVEENIEQVPMVEEEVKKESLFTKIKDKWNECSKGQKIGFGCVALLLLLLIVLLIVFACVKGNGKDKDGNNGGDTIVEEAPEIKSNYYYKDGSLYFLNDKDEEIGSYACTNKSEDECYVALNSYRDTFDVPKFETTSGEEKINVVPIFEDNYVFIIDGNKASNTPISLYSIKENKSVATYYDVKAYDDNLVVVRDNSEKYGLIQISGGVKTVIKPTYFYLGMISGQKNLIAKTGKGYVVINQKNKVLSTPISGSYEIKYYNETFVVAVVNATYNVYDYKANMVTGGYSFITVSDNYAALIDNQRVYVVDDTGLKYNEDGVELKNDDYVKTYVYNDNDELEKIRNSFDVDTSGDDVSIVVYDDSGKDEYYYLDKITAQINKQYDYMNYFDGKLYFYKDKVKKELIGSYACNNENTVTNIKDTYTVCVPAMDTIYESNDMMGANAENRKTRSPLINNQFVFVTDGANTIYLYDLAKKTTIAPYSSINTYLDDNDGKFTSYNGTLSVIAVSKKSGLYGMITIKGSAVSSTYSFDYNKMEKLGNYILAQGTDAKWHLLSSSNDIPTIFPSKVVGYSSDLKHFKILAGTTYGVYDINANMVSSTVYSYVELYSDFFAAVNSNHELKIYNYQGREIISNSVMIGDYPYTNTETPAFKISKSGNTYTVLIYNGTEYEQQVLSLEPQVEETE